MVFPLRNDFALSEFFCLSVSIFNDVTMYDIYDGWLLLVTVKASAPSGCDGVDAQAKRTSFHSWKFRTEINNR